MKIRNLVKTTLENIDDGVIEESGLLSSSDIDSEYAESENDLDGNEAASELIETTISSLEAIKISIEDLDIPKEMLPLLGASLNAAMAPIHVDMQELVTSIESMDDVQIHEMIQSNIEKLTIAQEGIIEDAIQGFRDFFGFNEKKNLKLVNELKEVAKDYIPGDGKRTIKSLKALSFNGVSDFTNAIKGYAELVEIQEYFVSTIEPTLIDYLKKKLAIIKEFYRVIDGVLGYAKKAIIYQFYNLFVILDNIGAVEMDDVIRNADLNDNSKREIKKLFEKVRATNKELISKLDSKIGNGLQLIGGKELVKRGRTDKQARKYGFNLFVYDRKQKSTDGEKDPITKAQLTTLLKLADKSSQVYRTNRGLSEKLHITIRDTVRDMTDSGSKVFEKSVLMNQGGWVRQDSLVILKPIVKLARLNNSVLQSFISAVKASK